MQNQELQVKTYILTSEWEFLHSSGPKHTVKKNHLFLKKSDKYVNKQKYYLMSLV